MLDPQFSPGLGRPAAAAHDNDPLRVAQPPAQARIREKSASHLVAKGRNEESDENLRYGSQGLTGLKIEGQQRSHDCGACRSHQRWTQELARPAIETKRLHALLP